VEREVVEAVERPGAKRADAGLRLLLRQRLGGQRRAPPVGWIDDDRRVAEGADADLVAQERFLIHRAESAGLVAAGALQELLRRQRDAIGLRRGSFLRNAAHVVGRERSLNIGMAPRRARRLPAWILDLCSRRLGWNRTQRRRCSS